MARVNNTLGPLVAYHGCDKDTAEKVLNNQTQLKASDNSYDWLGPGIYFWIDSPERGMDWALEQVEKHNKKNKISKTPYVIGAFIHPGLCFNLTDYGVMPEMRQAYEILKSFSKISKVSLPKNKLEKDGIVMVRHLDCAVVKTVHQLRADENLPAYDTVYGVFEEGKPLYEGSAFKDKTHIQIAVRNTQNILGYFRVAGY